MFGQKKIAMVVAEFLGTFSLVCAVYAMFVRTTFPFFPAAAAGATLALMSLVVGNVSGAHLNPALTIGLWTRRKVETTTAVVYVAVQMLGGLVAWRVMEYLLNMPLHSIAGSSFSSRVLVAEAIGAFIFTFGVAAAIYQNYKGLRLATVAGGALFLGIMVAGFGSNGLINPAVALGVKSWSWAYSVGPLVGALLGANVYGWVFVVSSGRPKVLARLNTRRSTATTPAKKPRTTARSTRTKKRLGRPRVRRELKNAARDKTL